MKAKIIIIPPDGAKISDYFEYGLTDDINHNDVLYEYCIQNRLEHNDIINLVSEGYVIIYTHFNLYGAFVPDDISNNQIKKLEKLFDRGIVMESAIISKKELYKLPNASCFEEFVKGYKDNDLIKEKGGINYVR